MRTHSVLQRPVQFPALALQLLLFFLSPSNPPPVWAILQKLCVLTLKRLLILEQTEWPLWTQSQGSDSARQAAIPNTEESEPLTSYWIIATGDQTGIAIRMLQLFLFLNQSGRAFRECLLTWSFVIAKENSKNVRFPRRLLQRH